MQVDNSRHGTFMGDKLNGETQSRRLEKHYVTVSAMYPLRVENGRVKQYLGRVRARMAY